MYYEEDDSSKISKTGIIEIDSNYPVIKYLEKPKQTNSNLAVPPFYCVHNNDLKTLVQLKGADSFYDSPGQLMSTLSKHTSIKAYPMEGFRIDISEINIDK